MQQIKNLDYLKELEVVNFVNKNFTLNQLNILVVIPELLASKYYSLLTKILGSIKIIQPKVTCKVVSYKNVDLVDLADEAGINKFDKLMCFEIADNLEYNYNNYINKLGELYSIKNQDVMFAPQIELLFLDPVVKKKLWQKLQMFFK